MSCSINSSVLQSNLLPVPMLSRIVKPDLSQTKSKYKDWDAVIAQEEGELFVVRLVEELVQKAGAVVYEHYIQRRVVPYAVLQAKDHLIQILQYFFLECDVGEQDVELDSSWKEDEGEHCVYIEPN